MSLRSGKLFFLGSEDEFLDHTGQTVINNMDQGAEYFYQTWKICEDRKNKVK